MNDVEFVGAAPHLPQHGERAADVIADAGQSQTLRRASDEPRGGLRFSAGEQGHLVTLMDKLFGEPRHDALRAAIKFRGHRFGQRRYERYAHKPILNETSFDWQCRSAAEVPPAALLCPA